MLTSSTSTAVGADWYKVTVLHLAVRGAAGSLVLDQHLTLLSVTINNPV